MQDLKILAVESCTRELDFRFVNYNVKNAVKNSVRQ